MIKSLSLQIAQHEQSHMQLNMFLSYIFSQHINVQDEKILPPANNAQKMAYQLLGWSHIYGIFGIEQNIQNMRG